MIQTTKKKQNQQPSNSPITNAETLEDFFKKLQSHDQFDSFKTAAKFFYNTFVALAKKAERCNEHLIDPPKELAVSHPENWPEHGLYIDMRMGFNRL